jgi:gamma-glutamylcyclotransferase (GGCT)/AIG2-like uncharacterized protein YtfP
VTTTYFAYGSNLSPVGMQYRAPAAEPLATAELEGWRLVFRGVADIIEAPGETVTGALWELSDSCLEALDMYEGAPRHYARRDVTVETEAGPKGAMTYVMVDPYGLQMPPEGYLASIVEGYEFWQLDTTYLGHALVYTADQEEAGHGYHPAAHRNRRRARVLDRGHGGRRQLDGVGE